MPHKNSILELEASLGFKYLRGISATKGIQDIPVIGDLSSGIEAISRDYVRYTGARIRKSEGIRRRTDALFHKLGPRIWPDETDQHPDWLFHPEADARTLDFWRNPPRLFFSQERDRDILLKRLRLLVIKKCMTFHGNHMRDTILYRTTPTSENSDTEENCDRRGCYHRRSIEDEASESEYLPSRSSQERVQATTSVAHSTNQTAGPDMRQQVAEVAQMVQPVHESATTSTGDLPLMGNMQTRHDGAQQNEAQDTYGSSAGRVNNALDFQTMPPRPSENIRTTQHRGITRPSSTETYGRSGNKRPASNDYHTLAKKTRSTAEVSGAKPSLPVVLKLTSQQLSSLHEPNRSSQATPMGVGLISQDIVGMGEARKIHTPPPEAMDQQPVLWSQEQDLPSVYHNHKLPQVRGQSQSQLTRAETHATWDTIESNCEGDTNDTITVIRANHDTAANGTEGTSNSDASLNASGNNPTSSEARSPGLAQARKSHSQMQPPAKKDVHRPRQQPHTGTRAQTEPLNGPSYSTTPKHSIPSKQSDSNISRASPVLGAKTLLDATQGPVNTTAATPVSATAMSDTASGVAAQSSTTPSTSDPSYDQFLENSSILITTGDESDVPVMTHLRDCSTTELLMQHVQKGLRVDANTFRHDYSGVVIANQDGTDVTEGRSRIKVMEGMKGGWEQLLKGCYAEGSRLGLHFIGTAAR